MSILRLEAAVLPLPSLHPYLFTIVIPEVRETAMPLCSSYVNIVDRTGFLLLLFHVNIEVETRQHRTTALYVLFKGVARRLSNLPLNVQEEQGVCGALSLF